MTSIASIITFSKKKKKLGKKNVTLAMMVPSRGASVITVYN